MQRNTALTLRVVASLFAGGVLGCDVEPSDASQGTAGDTQLDAGSDGDTDESNLDPGESPDEFAAPQDSAAALFPANWDLTLVYAGGANGQAFGNLSWDVNFSLPTTYQVCWKVDGASGDVCNNNNNGNSFDHDATTGNTTGGITGVTLALTCGETYKFRVKRGIYHDTKTFTFNCPCPDPCPFGGWYDGSNCQIGQAPSGTTAFVWGNGYYHTPRSTAPICPLPGSFFDSANCWVQAVPNGVTPFINNNYWYYGRVCTP